MKRFLALILTCITVIGLTACGGDNAYTEYETKKLDIAEQNAQVIVGILADYSKEAQIEEFSNYTAEEVAYIIEGQTGLVTDGYTFKKAMDSYNSGIKDIGEIVNIAGVESKIDGDQIIVDVTVEGDKGGSAISELIFSNDRFFVLEGAALNPVTTFGQKMSKAGLNTLLGMGTVFVVLIIIICVISLFNLIPKVQKIFAKKPDETESSVDRAVAQIVEKEEQELSNDTELVAVIAAAIAAFEGASNTDGFVVRSVRKIGRARR
ncbi:MAG: OadG family protein [Lachnospiraceae bacterium]|nr:OadG family protein [Lachnospiraceae bacterium]